MKTLFAFVFLISSFSQAADVSFKACNLNLPEINVAIVVHDEDFIDFTAANLTVDPKLLTSTKNLKVVMKLKVLKNEISTPILNFYEQLGVKDIVEEMEYAAFPTEIQESSPAFMINVITQEKGAMGLNIGIQAGGGSAINTNAPIQMAFVGSTENCR